MQPRLGQHFSSSGILWVRGLGSGYKQRLVLSSKHCFWNYSLLTNQKCEGYSMKMKKLLKKSNLCSHRKCKVKYCKEWILIETYRTAIKILLEVESSVWQKDCEPHNDWQVQRLQENTTPSSALLFRAVRIYDFGQKNMKWACRQPVIS